MKKGLSKVQFDSPAHYLHVPPPSGKGIISWQCPSPTTRRAIELVAVHGLGATTT